MTVDHTESWSPQTIVRNSDAGEGEAGLHRCQKLGIQGNHCEWEVCERCISRRRLCRSLIVTCPESERWRGSIVLLCPLLESGDIFRRKIFLGHETRRHAGLKTQAGDGKTSSEQLIARITESVSGKKGRLSDVFYESRGFWHGQSCEFASAQKTG